jgi:positive regulator of sigma E activity
MSIFITLLAFSDETIINNAKFAILMASLISGISGYVFLRMQSRKIGFQTKRQKNILMTIIVPVENIVNNLFLC